MSPIPKAPAVYKPTQQPRSAAPPVYRPQVAPAQAKPGQSAPPVYRPQQSNSVRQSAPLARSIAPLAYRPQASPVKPAAPAIYRPQTGRTQAQAKPAKQGNGAPPIYRPHASPMVQRAESPRDRITIIDDYMGASPVASVVPFPVGAEIEEPEVASLRGNFNFVSAAPRQHMFTESGRGVLKMDLLDTGELNKVITGARSATSKSNPVNTFKAILVHVESIATNKVERDKQILETGQEDLADMVKKGFTMCWEKAALMHFMLTDFGIPCCIRSGKKKTDKESHHAWVELEGLAYCVEATAGVVAPKSEYDNEFDAYDIKVVARPKKALAAGAIRDIIIASGKLVPKLFRRS